MGEKKRKPIGGKSTRGGKRENGEQSSQNGGNWEKKKKIAREKAEEELERCRRRGVQTSLFAPSSRIEKLMGEYFSSGLL